MVEMEIKTYKLHYAGKLMPWGKGCVVKNPNGWIFLGGTEGRDPDTDEVMPGIEAQARLCFEKIKANLEEMGSSLDNIVKLWYYIVGDYPQGLAASDMYQTVVRVREEFFREHAPQLCMDNNPPTFDLIGVKHLARPEMIIEIACTAVL